MFPPPDIRQVTSGCGPRPLPCSRAAAVVRGRSSLGLVLQNTPDNSELPFPRVLSSDGNLSTFCHLAILNEAVVTTGTGKPGCGALCAVGVPTRARPALSRFSSVRALPVHRRAR